MSIAQFALAERSVAETRASVRRGRTPSTRLAVALSDRATTAEPR